MSHMQFYDNLQNSKRPPSSLPTPTHPTSWQSAMVYVLNDVAIVKASELQSSKWVAVTEDSFSFKLGHRMAKVAFFPTPYC